MQDPQHIRKRLVCLTRTGSPTQAEEACKALRGVHGIVDVRPLNHHRLQLTYSLEFLTFELIEELLRELGFYLDNSIFSVIRRNIYQYLEDTAREKIHVEEEQRKLVCEIDTETVADEPEKYWNNYR